MREKLTAILHRYSQGEGEQGFPSTWDITNEILKLVESLPRERRRGERRNFTMIEPEYDKRKEERRAGRTDSSWEQVGALNQEINRLKAYQTAVSILLDGQPGAAYNAVREDYPELAAKIEKIRGE